MHVVVIVVTLFLLFFLHTRISLEDISIRGVFIYTSSSLAMIHKVVVVVGPGNELPEKQQHRRFRFWSPAR